MILWGKNSAHHKTEKADRKARLDRKAGLGDPSRDARLNSPAEEPDGAETAAWTSQFARLCAGRHHLVDRIT